LLLAVCATPATIPWPGVLQGRLNSAEVDWRIMSSTVTMAWEILDRAERAVATVRERLLRVTKAIHWFCF
jgi:hypothetical protein